MAVLAKLPALFTKLPAPVAMFCAIGLFTAAEPKPYRPFAAAIPNLARFACLVNTSSGEGLISSSWLANVSLGVGLRYPPAYVLAPNAVGRTAAAAPCISLSIGLYCCQ